MGGEGRDRKRLLRVWLLEKKEEKRDGRAVVWKRSNGVQQLSNQVRFRWVLGGLLNSTSSLVGKYL